MTSNLKKVGCSVIVVIFIIFLYLYFSSEASSKIVPSTSARNWQACEAATGKSLNSSFSGKVLVLHNVHTNSSNPENYATVQSNLGGTIRIVGGEAIILGDYDMTLYYYGQYNLDDFFTRKANEASAILCVSVSYKDIESCEYGSNENTIRYTIIRTIPTGYAKLISWPEGQLIAETSQTADMPDSCPGTVSSRYITEGGSSIYNSNLDIFQWLLGYKE